ncbi:hypothetical protein BU16DRAFT_596501 [Lophium mytilinum]|uniref:Uncharacterized protein n=1 Tax=Lophium mytilinum TaxID=390894 RepID=A0A6A6QEJ5_9PEZI|nr:hypothetical protein BU16DRAFT_596501 [Lophium mytilinum]
MTTPTISLMLPPCLPPHPSTTLTMSFRRRPQTRARPPKSTHTHGTYASPITLSSSPSTPSTATLQADTPIHVPPAPSDLIPVPTPLPYNILIGLRAPLFVNRAADPTTLLPELLRLAALRPQVLDYTYVGAHIPSNPVVFLCIQDFYGRGRSSVGFFSPMVEESWWEEWGDGAAEMFFTECSDAELAASEVMVAQIGEDWGKRGGGEAERVEAGSQGRGGARWDYRRLQRVVETFWHARLDEALVTRRPWMCGDV